MPLTIKFNDSDYEQTDCPLCGSDKVAVFQPVTQSNYVKCHACGLVYLNPRLNEPALMQYYSQSGFYSDYSAGSGYEIQEKALRNTFKVFLKSLKARNLTGGKLLEIGCGYGYLLDEARGYFNFRVGTDYSPEAVEQAKRYSDAVYCGGLEALPPHMCDFDVAIAFSVMEHVYHPHSFVSETFEKLAPEGKLIIATPNIGNHWYRLMKKRWPFFIPPEHVCLYDYDTIRMLYEKSGMRDIKVFDAMHAWPVAVFLSKFGIKIPCRRSIAHFPIAVPMTIVCASGTKPKTHS